MTLKMILRDVKNYKKEGYLVEKDFIDLKELETLLNELPSLFKMKDPRKILERNGEIRSFYGVHQVSNVFSEFCSLEKIVKPVEKLIGTKVYIHQSKINIKKALVGEWWEWHQDYPYWLHGDGMAKCQVISVMILLDEANEFNGPLYIVPGSHKAGIVPFQQKSFGRFGKKHNLLRSLSSDLEYTIRQDILKKWIDKRGIVTIVGGPGTAVFFHGNVFHASNSNIFPSDRKVLIITYNSVKNKLRQVSRKRRPEFLASLNFTPIKPIKDLVFTSTHGYE